MAILLPNGRQQFLDGNGKPLAGGLVYMYQPATTVPAATWQDANQTVPNTNPIMLDAAGECTIYGIGNYRQIVQDVFGNLIWDQPTGIGMSGTPGGFIYASNYGLRQGGSDATAIQAAINAAAAMPGGATVYLGPGPIAFNAGDQVVWPAFASGVSLKGDGPQATFITINGNLSTDVFVLTAGTLSYCQIRDLGITCNGIGSAGALIHFENTQTVHVENVLMEGGFWNGIQISGGTKQNWVQIRDLIAPGENTANAAIMIGDDINGTSNGVYVQNCKFYGSQFGVYVRDGYNVTVTGCTFEENGQSGFACNPGPGQSAQNINLNSCFIRGCSQAAYNISQSGGVAGNISISDCEASESFQGIAIGSFPDVANISITSCQIRLSKQQGIDNFGGQSVVIVGNVLSENGQQAANTYDAILIQNGTSHVVMGNMIVTDIAVAQHRYAINLTGNSDFAAIIGNVSIGNGTGAISNTATGLNNVVVNNTPP